MTLFIEGKEKGRDARVLSRLVPVGVTLKPEGSRYGLAQKVLFLQSEVKHQVMGLRDRDFDHQTEPLTKKPRAWTITQNTDNPKIGWTWERKEIENYLIDPDVIAQVFAKRKEQQALKDYRDLLEQAADRIAYYTAARTALSLSRKMPPPLTNQWGTKTQGWMFPSTLDKDSCRQEIQSIVNAYQIPAGKNALDLFETLCDTCTQGGVRRQDFLTYFAGKDLLAAMSDTLEQRGIKAHTIPEIVIKAMEREPAPWTWLPEWQALRDELKGFTA